MPPRPTLRIGAELAVAAINVGAGGIVFALCMLVESRSFLPPAVAKAVGFPLVYAGLLLIVWASLHLKRAMGGLVDARLDHIVRTGPCRFIRHPVYLGTAVSMLGLVVVFDSWPALLGLMLLFVPSEIHRARLEELAMSQRFGLEWAEYRAQTPCLILRIPRGARRPP